METLKAARNSAYERDIAEYDVLVVAENNGIWQEKRRHCPENARIEDDYVAADAIAQIATGYLRERVAVEKAGQECGHLSLVIVELFGDLERAYGHHRAHRKQHHSTEKERDYPCAFFFADKLVVVVVLLLFF